MSTLRPIGQQYIYQNPGLDPRYPVLTQTELVGKVWSSQHLIMAVQHSKYSLTNINLAFLGAHFQPALESKLSKRLRRLLNKLYVFHSYQVYLFICRRSTCLNY